MKVLKTFGFLVGITALVFIVSFVGAFVANLLSNAVNVETLVGQIIVLVIYSTINWNLIFFGTLFLSSSLLQGKVSTIIGLIWAGLYCVRDLLMINHWTMAIIFLVDTIAIMSPIIMKLYQIKQENKEEKEKEQQRLRDELKAEIIEEMKSTQAANNTESMTHILSDEEKNEFYKNLRNPARAYFFGTKTIRNADDNYTVIFNNKERYTKYSDSSQGYLDEVLQDLNAGREKPIHISLLYEDKKNPYTSFTGMTYMMFSDDEKEQP